MELDKKTIKGLIGLFNDKYDEIFASMDNMRALLDDMDEINSEIYNLLNDYILIGDDDSIKKKEIINKLNDLFEELKESLIFLYTNNDNIKNHLMKFLTIWIQSKK